MTMDGVGEWATSSIGVGEGNRIRFLEETHFPHSLGLLYSAFTYFTGFRPGQLGRVQTDGAGSLRRGGRYTDLIREKLVDIKEDGSFRLNMDYFGYLDQLVMTNGKFSALFGGPPRHPESPISTREMDIAKSLQKVTEEKMCQNLSEDAIADPFW